MSKRRPPDRTARLLIALGAAIRIVHLLANRSLYIDEARVAINLGMRSYAGLLRPLDLEQVAPVPFLYVEKFMVQRFGMSEPVLRFFPLAAGIVMLPLLWLVARRVLDRSYALLALALAAVSPTLIRESVDVKQYSLEALGTVVVVWLALKVLDDRGGRARTSWQLALGAFLVSMCTLTGVVTAGACLVLAGVTRWRRRDWPAVRILGGAAVASGALAAGAYVALYSQVARSAYLQEFWAGSYLRLWPSTDSHNMRIAADFVWGILAGGVPPRAGAGGTNVLIAIVTVCFLTVTVAGAVHLSRRQGPLCMGLFVLPILCFIGLNVIGVYPLRSRLEVVCIPLALFLVVGGIEAVGLACAPRPRRLLTSVAYAAIAVPAGFIVMAPRFWPYLQEELRPVTRAIADSQCDSTSVYVYSNALPGWTFYTTEWAHPDRSRVEYLSSLMRSTGPAFENAPADTVRIPDSSLEFRRGEHTLLVGRSAGVRLRPYVEEAARPLPSRWLKAEGSRIQAWGAHGIWLVFSHYRGFENALLDSLESRGMVQERAIQEVGAAAFLYRTAAGHACDRPSGTRK